MEQILIIVQGLVYSGLVVTLLANRLSKGKPGVIPILAATASLVMLHGLLTFFVPDAWRTTWFVFWVPGHILTPIILIWRRRAAKD